tara:strand:- start:136 stop:1938 length:1803 start_codon:yes stop_codon:yes gene_type:complete
MDSGRSPSNIDPNQCAYAENISFRGGFAQTRPGFKRIQFASSAAASAITETGGISSRFQGASYFDYGTGQIVVVVNGASYKITPPTSGDEWDVTDITNSITMSTSPQRVHMVQVEGYLIIQDGSSRPLIWDGGTAVRSDASTNQVPIGTGPMAYGQGRLWVAQGRNFVAGNILGGTDGTDGDNVLKFSENLYLAGGGAFSVPTNSGNISSMQFVASPNTALGQGELLVFTPDAVYSVVLPADRSAWADTQEITQRVILIHNGSMSHHSTELINGDVFFRSRDGIRSVIQAVRDFQTLGNTPMSREMYRVLKYDDLAYLQYVSGVLFNNRYLMTSQSDYDTDDGIAYSGLVALDFDLISGISGKAPPAYDGFWKLKITRDSVEHEMKFMQLVVGRFNEVERCMAFVRNNDGDTEMWELTNDDDMIEDIDVVQTTGVETSNKVTSELETPSFAFQQQGAAKTLESADLWMDEVTGGTVTFHADFHPDQYPCWVSWQDWSVVAESAAVLDCDSLSADYQKQYRPRMRLGKPSDAEEPATGKPFNYGWEFAARLKWTGHARMKLFRLNARETQEEPYADVDNMDSTSKAIACDCLSGVSSQSNP